MYDMMYDMEEDDPTLMSCENMKYGPNVCEIVGSSMMCTPDFIELKKSNQKEFLILVSCNLQRNHNAHQILSDANFYGSAVTTFTGYTLKRAPVDGVPVVFHMKRDDRNHWRYPVKKGFGVASLDTGKIEGELYGVSLRHLTHLDIVKRNGELVNRKLTSVELTSPINVRKYTKAFQYEANPNFLDENDIDPAYWRSCYGDVKGGVHHLSY